MSGTSLDGIDLAICQFTAKSEFQILKTKTYSYNQEWVQLLKRSIGLTAKKFIKLDHDYGLHLGNVINNFLDETNIKVDIIASHGHTIFHEPKSGFSTQIGNINDIHRVTNIPVINDFRSLDVAFGGSGAPLVPIGDMELFPIYTCLNLGGIANISFTQKNQVTAFDICPFNLLFNHYAEKQGLKYDNRGEIAAQGQPHQQLLNRLNEIHYYKHPSSLDKTWVFEKFIPLIDSFSISVEDILNTLCKHYIIQISQYSNKQEWIVTGGGAWNSYFIQQLSTIVKIKPISTELVDFKEALIFAFLGLKRVQNEQNTLKSVTKAEKSSVGGILLGDVTHLY